MGKPASEYTAKHFDPETDIVNKEEYWNCIKLEVEVKTEDGTFSERFGFSHNQYPDGSWKQHIDRTIQRFKNSPVTGSSSSGSSSTSS